MVVDKLGAAVTRHFARWPEKGIAFFVRSVGAKCIPPLFIFRFPKRLPS
jgi:hypothetical protein